MRLVSTKPIIGLLWLSAAFRPSPDHAGDDSGGSSMTIQRAIIPDVAADNRWRGWQARGTASDRRTAARMRVVMLLIMAALIAWFVIQLT
jgi:hypothetical protein